MDDVHAKMNICCSWSFLDNITHTNILPYLGSMESCNKAIGTLHFVHNKISNTKSSEFDDT